MTEALVETSPFIGTMTCRTEAVHGSGMEGVKEMVTDLLAKRNAWTYVNNHRPKVCNTLINLIFNTVTFV